MKNRITTLIIVLTFFLVSCSNEINKDNYDKINTGMSISEVESILGKSNAEYSSSMDLGQYGGNINAVGKAWKSGSKVISIGFSNDKVVAKIKTGF